MNISRADRIELAALQNFYFAITFHFNLIFFLNI